MKKIVAVLSVLLLAGAIIFYLFPGRLRLVSFRAQTIQKRIEKPLAKYSYTSLRKTKFPPSTIFIGKKIGSVPTYSSYIFYFNVPTFTKPQAEKKVSGLINIPNDSGTYPVIILLRGYADQKGYETGTGTQHDGEYFAAHGFVTLAPDFLGYGASSGRADDPFEDRFQTYTTTLTLLNSIQNLNVPLIANSGPSRADEKRIGIWAHSNGGQIALSVLEISGKRYPTVLWAPVSTSFPYSVLYYTDESNDQGKSLRKRIAHFETNYNADNYSLTNYLKWINAPLQIDQGTDDHEVPVWWSDDLADKLKDLGKQVEYVTYPGENHNFQNGSWTEAIGNSLRFFQKEL